MQKYVSSLTSCPNNYYYDSSIIEDELELIDYEGYIPIKVLTDLINIASHHIINEDAYLAEKIPSMYVDSLISLFCKLNTSIHSKTNSPVHVAVEVLMMMDLHSIDLRMLEEVREEISTVQECVRQTFNYKFDIGKLPESIIEFLNISDAQVEQSEKLPEDLIEVLNFNNEIGRSLFPSRIVSETKYGQMKSYGQIGKTNLTKMSRPDFYSKFAVKDLDVKNTVDTVMHGKKLIVGLSTNIRLKDHISLIFKLLGVLVLTNEAAGYNNEIIVYLDTGSNIEQYSSKDSPTLFRSSFQLSMFNRDNSDFLNWITFNNSNSSILFIPIFDKPCAVSSIHGCRINMIIPKNSNMKGRYNYTCSKTGGKVISI